VGKSTVLQGIAFAGVQEGAPKLPIVAKISKTRSVTTVAELEDRFSLRLRKESRAYRKSNPSGRSFQRRIS